MLPKPRTDLAPNTLEFEILPLVKPTGFREYDARWWFNGIGHPKAPELNLTGVQALGLGMATLFHELGVKPTVVTGHDFRSISQPIKNALSLGLVAGGCEVMDVGLALSPMVYWSQFELDAACCAMVTASHNENACRRARCETLGRTAPAHRDCAYLPEGCAYPDPRRGHLRARLRG